MQHRPVLGEATALPESAVVNWRRARGIVGTSILWTAAWLPLGLMAATYAVLDEDEAPVAFGCRWRHFAAEVAVYVLWGAASGAGFAALLALGERRRSVATLSFRRVTAWGALAALLLPLGVLVRTFPGRAGADMAVYLAMGFVLLVSAALGAGCAILTLDVARGAGTEGHASAQIGDRRA